MPHQHRIAARGAACAAALLVVFAVLAASPAAAATSKRTLVVAQAEDAGREIFRTDGTSAGTKLVKDLRRGQGDADPRHLTPFRGNVFFASDSGGPGYLRNRELWKTDGTAAGTRMVADVRPGGLGSGPRDLTVFDGKLYFTAKNKADGRDLWRSDGTAAGTKRFFEFSSVMGSAPHDLTVVGDFLFFGVDSRGVWRTDGARAGTRRVAHKDLTQDPWTPVEKKLYFTTRGTTGIRLWVTDGMSGGTSSIATLVTPAVGSINGAALYRTRSSEEGIELWRTKGTPASTFRLTDLPEGQRPSEICGSVGGRAYFDVDGGPMYRTDGTVAGTESLFEHPAFEVGGGSCHWEDYNGFLYTLRGDEGYRTGVYRTDGTEEGTRVVDAFARYWYFGNEVFEDSAGKLYLTFESEDGSDNGPYPPPLYVSDGRTDEGTYELTTAAGHEITYPDLDDMAAVNW